MMQNRTESKSTLQDSPLGCTFDHDFCLLALLDQIKAFFNFILEKFRALSAKSICLHCSIKQTLEIFTLKCFVHTPYITACGLSICVSNLQNDILLFKVTKVARSS